jgi:hypothetical protein
MLKWFLVPALAAIAALSSQSASAERVNVPFSFSAMGKAFPAGTYEVVQGINGGFVTLRTYDGTKTLISVLEPGVTTPLSDSSVVLRFDVDGQEFVLDSIQYHAKITTHMDKSHNKHHHNKDQERVVTGL